MTVVDLFAGCGGWDLGARRLGFDPIGLEIDRDACATRAMHGMPTIRCDIADYPPEAFRGVDGLIASPPCGDGRVRGRCRHRPAPRPHPTQEDQMTTVPAVPHLHPDDADASTLARALYAAGIDAALLEVDADTVTVRLARHDLDRIMEALR